jgi:uncharacterized protein YabN with tetrapyrrole methylase and pyrophosphatase domain
MKDLIEESYLAIANRGIINGHTSVEDFLDKLDEEVLELKEYYSNFRRIDNQEIADVIIVSLNMARHFGIDIERELRIKIQINKNRTDGKQS